MTPTEIDPIRNFFDGASLAKKQHVAAYLVTLTEDGWPHTAMISVGELVIGAEVDLALALWSGSRTQANIVRSGRAVLLMVLDAVSYRVRFEVGVAGNQNLEGLVVFVGTVSEVSSEAVSYAHLDSGIRVRLRNSSEVLTRWKRTVTNLRARVS